MKITEIKSRFPLIYEEYAIILHTKKITTDRISAMYFAINSKNHMKVLNIIGEIQNSKSSDRFKAIHTKIIDRFKQKKQKHKKARARLTKRTSKNMNITKLPVDSKINE